MIHWDGICYVKYLLYNIKLPIDCSMYKALKSINTRIQFSVYEEKTVKLSNLVLWHKDIRIKLVKQYEGCSIFQPTNLDCFEQYFCLVIGAFFVYSSLLVVNICFCSHDDQYYSSLLIERWSLSWFMGKFAHHFYLIRNEAICQKRNLLMTHLHWLSQHLVVGPTKRA